MKIRNNLEKEMVSDIERGKLWDQVQRRRRRVLPSPLDTLKIPKHNNKNTHINKSSYIDISGKNKNKKKKKGSKLVSDLCCLLVGWLLWVELESKPRQKKVWKTKISV